MNFFQLKTINSIKNYAILLFGGQLPTGVFTCHVGCLSVYVLSRTAHPRHICMSHKTKRRKQKQLVSARISLLRQWVLLKIARRVLFTYNNAPSNTSGHGRTPHRPAAP